MPFSTTGSVISTDLDNVVRGLYRDNSDVAVTGQVIETTLKSISIGGNTIGPTGAIHVICLGTIVGVAGTKTMRLKFGGVTLDTITFAAGTTTPWSFDAWIFNTATNAQRILSRRTVNDAQTIQTSTVANQAIDTTANQQLLVTGQLGNAGDTITATIFDVFVVQIT